MADNLNVYKYCSRCNGTGKIQKNGQPYDPVTPPSSEITCPRCNGAGKILWGIMLEEEVEGE